MALVMMPNDTVLIGFNEIRDDVQNLLDSPMKQLLIYFEEHWLIDIDIWNVSTANIRTNNICESKIETDFVVLITIVFCHWRLP